MRSLIIVAACLLLTGIPAAAQTLKAHEHGHSKMTIAVGGNEMAIELEAPGSELVGFEYAPKNDGDRTAVEAAKKKLSDPVKLFGISQSSGCSVVSSDIELELEGSHGEFHATYALECDNPSELVVLRPTFFDAFPGAAELEVVVSTERGTLTGEYDAESEAIDLTGLF